METKLAPIKVQFGEDIRRFSLSTPSFEAVREIVLDAFPELKSTGFKLKYKDEEGDYISVTCDTELREALHQPLLRLIVTSEETKQDVGEKKEAVKEKEEAASPSPSTCEVPAFDFASLMQGIDLGSIFAGLQPPKQQEGAPSSPQAQPFDLSMLLPLLNEFQRNQQSIFSILPQIMNDPATVNALPALFNVAQSSPGLLPSLLEMLQRNPALLQLVPQLINIVARNPELLNMLPLLLNSFAPTQNQTQQQPQPPQQPQQTQQPQQPQQTASPLLNMLPLFLSTLTQNLPQQQQQQQQPQQQQQQPQQATAPSPVSYTPMPQQSVQPPQQYTPEQWTFTPASPVTSQAQFQPPTEPRPYSCVFQPTTQDPSPPTFSFVPNPALGEAAPSFTFGNYNSQQSSPIAPSSTSVEERFKTELEQLQSMGFTNAEANRLLLLKNDGDMVATVQDLTGGAL